MLMSGRAAANFQAPADPARANNNRHIHAAPSNEVLVVLADASGQRVSHAAVDVDGVIRRVESLLSADAPRTASDMLAAA